jgi:Zn-dependent protease with chaperone function
VVALEPAVPRPSCCAVGAIIPLFLALLILQVHHGLPAPGASPLALAGVVVGLWFLATAALSRLLIRRGDRRTLRLVELASQGASLGLLAWLCREQGWAAWAPGWVAGLAPWLLMQIAWWWNLTPAIRAITGGAWSRSGLILHHLRFELAPVLLVLPVLDLCEWAGRHLGTLAWFNNGNDGLILSLLGGWLLVLALLILLPLVLLPLWGARRLPEAELTRQLTADCAGLARLRVWRTPGGPVHNALAIGLVPGLRWVLVSEDLLRDMPPEQVRAVVGHELGHHRHGHLKAYLWFALAAMIGSMLVLNVLVGSVDAAGHRLSIECGIGRNADAQGLLFQLPGIAALPSEVVVWAALLACAGVNIRLLFGHISRACEREADIAGAEVAGPAAMAGALQTVARLSGTPEDEPSWRHHPIRERIIFLRALSRDPGLAALHRRYVRDMRLAIIAALALLAAMGASLWLDPLRESRNTQDPVGQIAAWTAKTPELEAALKAADAGDTGPLITWLARSQPEDRQKLAMLHLKLVERSGGTARDGKPLPPDDRTPWQLRHRFAALSVTRMEDNGSLGLLIDNIYAYGLVAGTARPSPQDIEQARSVLPRLETAVARVSEHSLHDTIACVRFVGRDLDGARRAWEAALANLAKDEHATEAERQDLRSLYQRRLDAATANLAIAAGSRTGQPIPLPLTFPVDAPKP